MAKEKPSGTVKPSRPVTEKKPERAARPASNPESREKQLVDLAVTLAEKQLRDGTASAAVIQHFLKLATKKETLEREILEKQAQLIQAKASSIAKGNEADELARQAIEAMKQYTSSS